MLTKEMIDAAFENVRGETVLTPLLEAKELSQLLGMPIYIKDETQQKTGAFKYRGVTNFIKSTPVEELEKGVITASSGNHGKAMSTAARDRGIPATVVLPDTAPQIKIDALKQVEAEILFSPPQERLQRAEKLSKERGLLFIHPFNDLRVIAGQSSIGMEIMEQLPEAQRVIVPMGGGGLITGIATAIKLHRPEIEMVGAETLSVPKFTYNLERETIEATPEKPSVADAILSNKPGEHTLRGVRAHVDRIVDVREENILKALKLLAELEGVHCEPSSAVTLGALLQEEFSDKKTVLVISGGNIAKEHLQELIRRVEE